MSDNEPQPDGRSMPPSPNARVEFSPTTGIDMSPTSRRRHSGSSRRHSGTSSSGAKRFSLASMSLNSRSRKNSVASAHTRHVRLLSFPFVSASTDSAYHSRLRSMPSRCHPSPFPSSHAGFRTAHPHLRPKVAPAQRSKTSSVPSAARSPVNLRHPPLVNLLMMSSMSMSMQWKRPRPRACVPRQERALGKRKPNLRRRPSVDGVSLHGSHWTVGEVAVTIF